SDVSDLPPSAPSPPPVKPAHAVIPVATQAGEDPSANGQRESLPVADLAASFQAALVDALVEKTVAAAAEFGAREVLVAGGVAANTLLRQSLGERLRIPYRYPPLSLCTDNAAMIAAAAYYRYAESVQHDFTFDIEPNARFV
ncbi:MAG TPA: tRNA (adenosine(37)-N6)-threonylcarbamoyltransferase complex transferase subunit TsaD, partial [Chloroflexia bacterium]|nr:tRNA (adenosine(37)-N6)-threonylcarbamoyltransferase complex transferase subunit TsaD [Chloroflexia bacterium]